MAPIYFSACGVLLDSPKSFCPSCGQSLTGVGKIPVKESVIRPPKTGNHLTIILAFIVLGAAAFIAGVFLASAPIPTSVKYYNTITELRAMRGNAVDTPLRLSGDIQRGSIQRNGQNVRFVLCEDALQMQVVYEGTDPLPETLRESASVLVSGQLGDDVFHASKVFVANVEPRLPPKPETKKEPTPAAQPDANISLDEIVRVMNKAAIAIYGKKLFLRYEGGPFATVELNPGLWETLTPLQQEAFGTRLAEGFSQTGQINCRVKVYGIEVGRVSRTFWEGYQYKPR